MKAKVNVYEPDNCLQQGYLSLFVEIAEEIQASKWLIYQLIKRDFSAMYRQSLFGVLWIVFIPIFGITGVFLLDKSDIVNIGATPVSFVLYATSGLAIWQMFGVGLVASTASLVKAGSMIVKINFSKKSLVISSFFQCFFPFLVLFAFSIVLCFVEGVKFTLLTALFPLLLLPLLLFTLGLGFGLALLNAIMRDIGNSVSVLVTFLMFFTPILYAAPGAGSYRYVVTYNPLYYLVSIPRDVLITGRLEHLYGYLISALLAVLMFGISITVFHIAETRIAERI